MLAGSCHLPQSYHVNFLQVLQSHELPHPNNASGCHLLTQHLTYFLAENGTQGQSNKWSGEGAQLQLYLPLQHYHQCH